MGEIVDLVGAVKASRLLGASAPELAFAADAGKGEGWLARLWRQFRKRWLKADKGATAAETAAAEKKAQELRRLQPAQDSIPIDTRLEKLFSNIADDVAQKATIIRSLTAAAQAAGRSLPDLVESVWFELGRGYARFRVSPTTGNPLIIIDPDFFAPYVLGTENNPITQEMLALHEIIHAEEYAPFVTANGGRGLVSEAAWNKYLGQRYPTTASRYLQEVRVQNEAWVRLCRKIWRKKHSAIDKIPRCKVRPVLFKACPWNSVSGKVDLMFGTAAELLVSSLEEELRREGAPNKEYWLNALRKETGQDFGFDIRRWDEWIRENASWKAEPGLHSEGLNNDRVQ